MTKRYGKQRDNQRGKGAQPAPKAQKPGGKPEIHAGKKGGSTRSQRSADLIRESEAREADRKGGEQDAAIEKRLEKAAPAVQEAQPAVLKELAPKPAEVPAARSAFVCEGKIQNMDPTQPLFQVEPGRVGEVTRPYVNRAWSVRILRPFFGCEVQGSNLLSGTRNALVVRAPRKQEWGLRDELHEVVFKWMRDEEAKKNAWSIKFYENAPIGSKVLYAMGRDTLCLVAGSAFLRFGSHLGATLCMALSRALPTGILGSALYSVGMDLSAFGPFLHHTTSACNLLGRIAGWGLAIGVGRVAVGLLYSAFRLRHEYYGREMLDVGSFGNRPEFMVSQDLKYPGARLQYVDYAPTLSVGRNDRDPFWSINLPFLNRRLLYSQEVFVGAVGMRSICPTDSRSDAQARARTLVNRLNYVGVGKELALLGHNVMEETSHIVFAHGQALTEKAGELPFQFPA